MSTALLVACLLVAVPDPYHGLEDFLVGQAPRFWGEQRQREFGLTLAKRVRVESARRGLDPLAMVSIAWVESNFKPWVTYQRDGSVGIWQTLPHDVYPDLAWKRLAGCKPPKRLRAWQHPHWLRVGRGHTCEDQEVADARTHVGYLRADELRDVVVGTYVAALEVRAHLDKAKERGRVVRGTAACAGLPTGLPSYALYNSPKSPRPLYIDRLCQRYRAVLKALKE